MIANSSGSQWLTNKTLTGRRRISSNHNRRLWTPEVIGNLNLFERAEILLKGYSDLETQRGRYDAECKVVEEIVSFPTKVLATMFFHINHVVVEKYVLYLCLTLDEVMPMRRFETCH